MSVGLSQIVTAASNSPDTPKKEDSKGLVEDLGRGLKSAAQNIEKEIPKIGPAIGDTVKNRRGLRETETRNPVEGKEIAAAAASR